MPQPPKKQVDTQPTPGLMRRLFGGPVSESTAAAWPELEKSWAGREIEMPSETAATHKVRPMNWYEKYAVGPSGRAIAWPWGTIALDREGIEREKMDLDDLLVHELTHVGQVKKSGLAKHLKETIGASPEYLARPYEQEAFEAEASRNVRRTDIPLPTQRGIDVGLAPNKVDELARRQQEMLRRNAGR